MRHIKLFNEHILNEGKHGRFEIYGKNADDEEQVIGYATSEENADNLTSDFEDDFDRVWWEDTYEELV